MDRGGCTWDRPGVTNAVMLQGKAGGGTAGQGWTGRERGTANPAQRQLLDPCRDRAGCLRSQTAPGTELGVPAQTAGLEPAGEEPTSVEGAGEGPGSSRRGRRGPRQFQQLLVFQASANPEQHKGPVWDPAGS